MRCGFQDRDRFRLSFVGVMVLERIGKENASRHDVYTHNTSGGVRGEEGIWSHWEESGQMVHRSPHTAASVLATLPEPRCFQHWLSLKNWFGPKLVWLSG